MKFIFIFIIAFFAQFQNAKAEVISLLADVWCPYNCEPDSENPGFGIEIAKYAFEKAGHTLEYKNMPWARAIETSRTGGSTGIIGAFRDDAPDFIFPQNPIAVSSNDFFAKKSLNWKFENINSLDPVSLGAIADYSYGDEVDGYIKANRLIMEKVQPVAGDNALEQNIKKLMADRVDVLIEDKSVMNFKLHEMGKEYTDNVEIKGSLDSEEIFIAFSPFDKKSQEYAQILDDGYNELKASGKLKEIMAKYGQ